MLPVFRAPVGGLALWLSACAVAVAPAEDVECRSICDEVVGTCGFSSWPSYDSCLDGCIAAGEAGADLVSHEACVSLAACDLFAVVDCELEFGAPPVEE